MKKTIVFILLLVLALGVTGCGSNTRENKVRSFNDLTKVPAFACKDLNGNAVNNNVFSDTKLTLVNIWTTG